MYYPFSWFKSCLSIAALYVPIVLIGLYFDTLYLALAIGSTSFLAVFSWQLFRFNKWVWQSKKLLPPKANGIWGHIYDGVYYIKRHNRRKRKELTKWVKRYREGSDALPDAIVVINPSASIVWCNRLARIELGLEWPQDRGRRIDNLIRHPEFIDYFQSGNYDAPVEIPSPTNTHKIFEYKITRYGKKHMLLSARDVTRFTQLEQMRKDFVANVSHELRTPLTVINGYLETLPENIDVPPEFLHKAFTEMRSQSNRMQSLIEELLVLSRIEASSERVFEKVVRVPKVLQTIKSEAQTLNADKNHTLKFQIDRKLNVYGIESELRSAFSNLIFNAIKYTPPNGIISVSWTCENDKATFSVTDNGEGIPQSHVNRLTERFYRVDKARSRQTGGSGLGLSIVKHVLTHHNSKLDIVSEVGKGSCFSFSFANDLTVLSKRASAKN